MKKKVAIGMSGGVDSAVAAYLLKKKGYDVTGITMQVWPEDDYYEEREGGCCSISSVEDARRVAYKLDIPFYVFNFKDEFKEKVIDYFTSDYLKGNTPNPCIACNKYIKFDSLLNKVAAMGFDYVATGHYCRIEKIDNRFILKRAIDLNKDQSYALYNLSQYQLEHTLFPCGDYTKPQIREIAKEVGLQVHNKKDSEEICFIPDNDHGGYIKRFYPKDVTTGLFKDKDGKVLGEHKGIVYYTIGQRKGLGISLGKPRFVVNIDSQKNEILLGDEEEVFKNKLIVDELNFIAFSKLDEKINVQAKIRYSAPLKAATIEPLEDNCAIVTFNEKVRALTKGQSIVFYQDDIVLGGGIIKEIL
ncbi:MAG TPA: tRNA 2-thiouridine(34) synthase MnmA [Clostridiaceae bacterium]